MTAVGAGPDRRAQGGERLPGSAWIISAWDALVSVRPEFGRRSPNRRLANQVWPLCAEGQHEGHGSLSGRESEPSRTGSWKPANARTPAPKTRIRHAKDPKMLTWADSRATTTRSTKPGQPPPRSPRSSTSRWGFFAFAHSMAATTPSRLPMPRYPRS